MSIFVDTGVFFAHHDRAAARHEAALSAMQTVLSGRYGRPITSDYILDEAVTLTRSRTGRQDHAAAIANRILGRGQFPDRIELVTIEQRLLQRSLAVFERYDDHELSFTDASTVAVCERHEIDAVCSFDDDFDGICERVDPRSIAN